MPQCGHMTFDTLHVTHGMGSGWHNWSCGLKTYFSRFWACNFFLNLLFSSVMASKANKNLWTLDSNDLRCQLYILPLRQLLIKLDISLISTSQNLLWPQSTDGIFTCLLENEANTFGIFCVFSLCWQFFQSTTG